MGILRGKFETHFARPLTQMLPGEEASQRAAMILAVIAGFQVMRQIVEITGLTQVAPDQLVQQLEAIFELLVKGRSVVVPK
jgi:hypothetical protein